MSSLILQNEPVVEMFMNIVETVTLALFEELSFELLQDAGGILLHWHGENSAVSWSTTIEITSRCDFRRFRCGSTAFIRTSRAVGPAPAVAAAIQVPL